MSYEPYGPRGKAPKHVFGPYGPRATDLLHLPKTCGQLARPSETRAPMAWPAGQAFFSGVPEAWPAGHASGTGRKKGWPAGHGVQNMRFGPLHRGP